MQHVRPALRSMVALLAIAAAFGAIGVTSAAPAQSHVSVYFLRGEQLARVTRPGTTPLDAVRQLIAGPTPAERKLGFRTYVPGGHARARRDGCERHRHGRSELALRVGGRRREPAGPALAARPHADRPRRRQAGAAPRERRPRRRPVPRRLDGPPDHVPVPRDAERDRAEAAADRSCPRPTRRSRRCSSV